MVIAVRTERGPDGLEVVKEADTDDGRERLHHEAEMLGRAVHPGVVELLSAGPGVVRLRHRGTSLSRLGALPPDHVAAMVRSVAEVVDALHRQGIAHTRIDTDHVVVGDRGRPRLCGFAEAAEATDERKAADVADLGRLLDDLLDASGDALWSPVHRGVRLAGRRRKALSGFRAAARSARRDDPGQRPTARQFAAALHDALPDLALPVIPPAGAGQAFASLPADIDPTADIGWTDDDLSYLTAHDDDDDAGDPFAKLAALTDPEPSPDPPPSSEGGTDGEPTPPTPPTDPTPADPPAEPEAPAQHAAPTDRDPLPPIRIRPPSVQARPAARRPSRRALILIAVVVLALGAVAGAVIARSVQPFGGDEPTAGADRAAETAGNGATEDDADAGAGGTTVAPLPPTPPTYPPSCTVPATPGPDVDGDGCPEPVTLEGRVATVGNVQVELGEDGDIAVVADHDCDGIATPVLLRPGSGELFLFAEWNLDEPVEADAATVIPDATSIDTTPEQCPFVMVTDADGAEHVVAGPNT